MISRHGGERKTKMNYGIIFAGGSGRRMNTKAIPKQFLEMNGKAIIIHTIEYFERCEEIDGIVVVCLEAYISYLKSLLEVANIKKVIKIVKGGNTGQESIYNGLCAADDIADKKEKNIVLIHDGVRPLISEQLLVDNIQMVQKYGSAITITPATETIILAENNETISQIMKREKCYIAKAPQSFYLADILNAHRMAINEGLTDCIDSATLMKHYGYKLHLVEGPVENIKITNPVDFYVLRAIYEARENSQIFGI